MQIMHIHPVMKGIISFLINIIDFSGNSFIKILFYDFHFDHFYETTTNEPVSIFCSTNF